ncbi:pyridoxal-dependent decarboxylase [Hyaloraphidium curvatum]|nr:pyridoxal-dependent decarboxylase [Hyaloraphidium curvatum]
MPASDASESQTRFPASGLPAAEVASRLQDMKEGDAAWKAGRVPLYVFGAVEGVAEVGQAAFNAYFSENALGGKRAFHSLRRMEDEVVAMALDLFLGPPGAQGNMTSGGTESIVMAVKACRDHSRQKRGDSQFRGNLVLPVTAHPAFDKGAALMDLPVRRVPVGEDLRADVSKMAAAIDADTIMIVGSVPCFPYGVVDPIPALSELAISKDVWLHVDACVGGYLAPFARDLGLPIPDFDFALPGVSSLSADLHKFGMCPKPASTVFYRTPALHAHQLLDLDVWPNGRFATHTLAGTRPGGAVAAAWAVLRYLGREGYVAMARRLIATREAYVKGIEGVPGMRVYGKPDLTIVSFGHPRKSADAIAAGMARRGWVPGMVRQPPGLHLMLSLLHEGAVEEYVRDLRESVEEAEEVEDGGRASAVY